MTKQEILTKKYGDPLKDQASFEKKFMVIYKYPLDIALAIPSLGASIYINKDFVNRYELFLRELIKRKLHNEITSNDECFNVRKIRGATKAMSIHSWAFAVDLNSKDNPLGYSRDQAIKAGLKPFSAAFQQCARDCGLQAGYDFARIDGMHFEIGAEDLRKISITI